MSAAASVYSVIITAEVLRSVLLEQLMLNRFSQNSGGKQKCDSIANENHLRLPIIVKIPFLIPPRSINGNLVDRCNLYSLSLSLSSSTTIALN